MKYNLLKIISFLGFIILSYNQQQKKSQPTVPNENEIVNDNNNIKNKKNKQDSGHLSEFNKEWGKK